MPFRVSVDSPQGGSLPAARGGWGSRTNRNPTAHLTTALRVWPQYSNLFLQLYCKNAT